MEPKDVRRNKTASSANLEPTASEQAYRIALGAGRAGSPDGCRLVRYRMYEKVPTPSDKLLLIAKREVFKAYFNIVAGLTNRMATILVYLKRYDRNTGQDLSHLDAVELFARMDDETRELARVKGEAGDFLDVLSDILDKEGEGMWEKYKLELGEWIERLISHKVACDYQLFELDEEIEFAANRLGGKA